ncbi:MAG TPA: MFS transporter, partial [Burkholderiaceae bacterium]
LVPGSLALLGANFPQSERGRAIGTWSAFSGITAAVGPVVGGLLVDRFSWRWAFLLNLPFGLLLLAACLAKVPESRGDAAQGPVDIVGASTATIGLAGVVFALIEAPTRGWGALPVVAAGAAGLAGLAAFVAWEARAAAPMLPLHLFRDRNFSGANLLTLLLYAALGGSLYFVPLDLIQVQGFSATAAGAALLPFVAIMFALSRWAGALVDAVGAKRPLVAGPAIAAAGFALLARPGVGGSYWTTFFPGICVLGLGMTITISPLTTTVMNALGEGLAGVASGVNNAVSRAAGLLAIAALGAVLAHVFEPRLQEALAQARLPADIANAVVAQRHKLAAIAPPEGAASAVAAQVHAAVSAAFVAGFRAVMLVAAALAAGSALCAWWLISDRPPSPDSKGRTP